MTRGRLVFSMIVLPGESLILPAEAQRFVDAGGLVEHEVDAATNVATVRVFAPGCDDDGCGVVYADELEP